MENRNFILRRCTGNTKLWAVVLLREDGTETELYSCMAISDTPGNALHEAIRIGLFGVGCNLRLLEE